MSGYAPLSHAEIDAWARLNCVRPEPYEVEALLALDRVMRSVQS